MKKISIALLAVVMTIAFCVFSTSATASSCSQDHSKQVQQEFKVCSSCGHIKGTEQCCVPDAPKCSKCGLAKGSIGCCKNLPEDAVLCGKCGAVKGSPQCCVPEAPKCSKCGLIKGTPGCCKLPL